MVTRQAVLSCLAAFCITASCGFMNSWGVCVMYITSRLRLIDASVTANQVGIVVTWMFGVYMFAFMFSVRLVDKLGPKLTNLIGAILMALGLVNAVLITDVWIFVSVFGMCYGLGSGISFMTGTNVAVLHFTQNRGKAVGFCASGVAFGAVMYGLLFTYIVNPYNDLPDIQSQVGAQTFYYFGPDISGRVPLAFLVSAVVVLSLGVTGSLLMQVNTLPSMTFTDSREIQTSSSQPSAEEPLTTVGQAIRQTKFWKMLGALYCAQSFCFWIMMSYKNFGSLNIDDDHFLSYIGATGAILNGVARVLFPVLLDYFSFYSVNMCVLVCEAFLAFSIYFAVQSELAYLVVVSAGFFFQGSQFFPFSMLCLNEYGPVLGPKVFSYVASGSIIANAMPGIYYWLVVRNYGYFTSYFIQGIHSLVGLLLTYSLRRSSKQSLVKQSQDKA